MSPTRCAHSHIFRALDVLMSPTKCSHVLKLGNVRIALAYCRHVFVSLTFWRRIFFFQILAHPVFKI